MTSARVPRNLPASILDESRMALMMSSSCRPAASILSSRVAWCAETPSRFSRYAMPVIALSGVRISCDMLARKAPLARLAASAPVLASANWRVRSLTSSSRLLRWRSSSACAILRSVMSRKKPAEALVQAVAVFKLNHTPESGRVRDASTAVRRRRSQP